MTEPARLSEPKLPDPEFEPEFVRDAVGVEVAYRGKVSPSAERIKQSPLSYGRVEHFGDGIRKPSRAQTYRAPDLMVTMLANGTINLDMAQAGRAFRANFHVAGYMNLRALDPGKIQGARGPADPSEAAIDARLWIIGRLESLGGFNAPAARAAWFVLGYGLSICEWARRERFGRGGHLSETAARRIVHGAIRILAEIEIESRQ